MSDLYTMIMDYEDDLLDEDQVVELFQQLLDTGLVWQLQGHYARIALMFIEDGYITPKD